MAKISEAMVRRSGVGTVDVIWIVANRPNQMVRRRQAVARLRDSRIRLWGPRPQQSRKHPGGRVEKRRRRTIGVSHASGEEE